MTTPNYSDAERELRRVEEIERNKMQDRTKAIVEAAERLLSVAQVRVQRDADGTGWIAHQAIEVDDFYSVVEEALLDLACAVALPAEPARAWTRTPPREPGRYQIRYVGKFSDVHQHLAGVHIVEVSMRDPRALASGRVLPAVAMVYPLQAPGGDACAWELADSERLGVEWWPVPIQPPEET